MLRDYLTDLFPILELGTSAKMLSIVPLIDGGGLFETGAGGSAPKHVQQLVEGELPALGQPRRVPRPRRQLRAARPDAPGTRRAQVLADTLDRATGTFLDEDKSPEPHASAASTTAAATSTWPSTGPRSWPPRPTTPSWPRRSPASAETLAEQEEAIVDELLAVQGSPVDIGGYYQPDPAMADAVMRPSATFNAALATLG